MDPSVPVVVVTGTIGVGKTAIAMTMSEILHDRGIRHGLLEVDWLGEVYPAPYPEDPYSTRFAMENLAAIWPHYLEVAIYEGDRQHDDRESSGAQGPQDRSPVG